MYTRDEIINYRCPRWNDWPNLGLYMDQVVSVLEEHVAGFYPDDQQKPVTATMINNYVKQKLIQPSANKKYSRDHLAQLYIIFLLKSVLGLPDICGCAAYLTRDGSVSDSYNAFCGEIEAAVAAAFGGGRIVTEDVDVTRAVAQAFAYTLLARLCIRQEKLGSAE